MKWIKENWRWAALNLFALAVMANLLWRAGAADAARQAYNPQLVEGGKWAIRFLLLSLAMTPLHTLFGWRSAIKLRKPAGLWAFAFAAAHFSFSVAGAQEDWLRYPVPDYIAALGVAALAILSAMAATSSRRAMKRMGRWWKRLHRLVYAAGIIIMAHALLETSNKRVASYDAQAALEIGVYLAVLCLLLAVRLPPIRSALSRLRQARQGAGRGRKAGEVEGSVQRAAED